MRFLRRYFDCVFGYAMAYAEQPHDVEEVVKNSRSLDFARQ